MDSIVRRRELAKKEIWLPVSKNKFTSWYRSNNAVQVSGSTVVFSPTSLGWSWSLTANQLNYKWSSAKTAKLRIVFDIKTTGCASNGYFAFAYGLFNAQSPNSSTARYNRYDLVIYGNGTNHIVHTLYPITLPSGSGGDDSKYFGTRCYAYTGNGSKVVLSNVEFELSFS